MIRVLIADDEPQLAQYLKDELLKLWPELDIVFIAKNGVEAAAKIAELQPDLAFLDIQMPGLSGLEVAQGIECVTKVVFVTAYEDYAVQAFDQAAVDYLLKPLKTERLARTLERIKATLLPQKMAASESVAESALADVIRKLTATSNAPVPRIRYLRAGRGDLMHQIAVDDVLFFHADDKYTVVQTAGSEHLLRMPILELVEQLDPDQFWQIHRSTLINLRHLSGTRRDESNRLFVRIKGYASELAVSRAYVHLFKVM